MKLISLSALCLSAAMALPAAATTVTLNYEGPGAFGTPGLFEQVSVNFAGPPAEAFNANAGAFSMVEAGSTDSFLAWCFDIFQNLGDGVTYDVVDASGTTNPQVSAQRDSLLNRLFTSFLGDVDTTEEAAGFQLAIWEIVNEDLSAAFGLTDGLFTASNNTGAVAQADSYLMNLGTEENYDLTYFVSADNQDIMTGSLAPVPLPAGMVLLVGGLGALGLMRRRSA